MMANRKERSLASKTTCSESLPDLTPNMSVSAIRQFLAAALKQSAEQYQLPNEGSKQTERLHAHLHTDESHSDESSNGDKQSLGS